MGTGCMKIRTYEQVQLEEPDATEINRVPKHVKKGQMQDDNLQGKDNGRKRRGSIQAKESVTYIEAAAGEIIVDASKTLDDKQKIIAALNNHFIFTSLTDEDKEMVAESMQLYQFMPDAIVFMQGMPSKSYYVVRTGILEVIVSGKRVNKIHPGEGFGELALLHDNPRSATLKCLEFTSLWGVERQTFRKVIEEMNTQIYEQNREFLEKVTLLNSLSSLQKDSLAASLVSYKYYSGQKIITEGETGNQLYIIKEGVVVVQRGTQEIAKLHAGSYFGEMALLNNTPRSATCVAVEGPVKCMCLSRETLQKTLNNKLQDIIERNTIMEAINKSEALSLLNREQKDAIVKDLHERKYKGGDVVIPMGSPCKSKIYIIISGRLQYAKTSFSFSDKGTCVGDIYITRSHGEELKYEDDLIAAADMKVGEMTKYQFELSIGGRYDEVVKENAATNVLKKVHLFSALENSKMKELFNMIRVEKFNDSEIVLREGMPSNNIFIVKRGKIDVFKSGNLIRCILKHDYFGERSALTNENSNATFVANGNITLWCISNAEFLVILNDKMRAQLMTRIRLEDEDVELKNLVIVKKLGKGMFAKVYMVKTDKNNFYALKVVSRRKINKFAINEQLILEKRILNQIDNPFIVKLVKSFKDSKRIYFLLEYIHGLELNVILRHVGLLTNSDSQFYIASMIIILQYLHEREIIYRDMKPENIVVDISGYIKLVDFGTAKLIQSRTYTLVGSPHYIAPEVIVGKGYNKMADVWSVGICLFEFLCGRVPFGEEEDDPYRIYEEILERPLEIPEDIDPIGEIAPKFIQQLLSKFADSRCTGSIESLKKHEYFTGFDWDGLLNKTNVPPYKPDIGDPGEDVQDDLDEPPSPWDLQLNQDSEESSDSLPDICDTEIEEYKKTIPYNWDQQFIS